MIVDPRIFAGTCAVIGFLVVSGIARGDVMRPGAFESASAAAVEKEGVREITYEQFMTIRSSGEGYLLFDVLPEESYANGHIPGARSLPVYTINKESAAEVIPRKDTPIVVYCGSFSCGASTAAAKALTGLGYTRVLDYKGGLKDWAERGNELTR